MSRQLSLEEMYPQITNQYDLPYTPGEGADPNQYFSGGGDPSSTAAQDIFGPMQGLGDPAQVSGRFEPGFIEDLYGNLDRQMGMIPGGAQMDLGAIPQPKAERIDYGYDPATLAQMRAGASENASRAGGQQMSAMRNQLERSGLSSSVAGAGVAGDIARQTGMAQNDALRNVDISNAQMQMGNQQSGIAAANAMALANANRMFEAMRTNTANNQTQIGAKTNMVGQFGGQLAAGQLGKQTNADAANAAAANRNKEINFGGQENRWQTGVNALGGLAGGSTGSFQPTQSPAGNILGSIGGAALDMGLSDIFKRDDQSNVDTGA